jgi:hypothetical protein
MAARFILQESPRGLPQAAAVAEASTRRAIIGGAAASMDPPFGLTAPPAASFGSAGASARAASPVPVGLPFNPKAATSGDLLASIQRALRPAAVLAKLGTAMY